MMGGKSAKVGVKDPVADRMVALNTNGTRLIIGAQYSASRTLVGRGYARAFELLNGQN